ncbi:MAG: molybdopterin-dependent oxidoreductase, partial [Acidimicrobiales bacterium]|nr:molybdopterin-dependent oxidoreductase [Acidimicrobiales bacterium]
MGSNMAEAHPVGFQWVIEAKARGARLIHIDPRFTRTSALADLHVTIRAGTDIAFLGGLVNYIIEHDKTFREYVVAYTNASFLVAEEYADTEDLGGLFSGYDPDEGSYDNRSWRYQRDEPSGAVRRDPALEDPRCVYQILRRHYRRYTPEAVEQICGTPRDRFLRVCEWWTEASGRERTAALVYSVGWTQHTTGAQCIRTASIIQLLLGNMGRPGGGVMALRGHASIQGSTDVPTLFNLLPGYLPMPTETTGRDLATYVEAVRADKEKGFWHHADAYTV